MITAAIRMIAEHLPAGILTNETIANAFPEWPAEKIEKKLGIRERHIAGPDEFTSDLAAAAAEKLIVANGLDRNRVDTLIVVTQTPDYLLPSTACLVQSLLHLPQTVAAFDLNLGCSGYVYALGVAKGFIESGLSKRLLLITADTYTKLLDPADQSVRALFGDGASATLLEGTESDAPCIGPFEFGTDGASAGDLMARGSALKPLATGDQTCLRMRGGEIFAFTMRVVPPAVEAVLAKAGLTLEQIDWVVFHQANAYMLDYLRQKCRIPAEKFVVSMASTGNTVSSSIPMALAKAAEKKQFRDGDRILLVGFGVGASWGACLITWAPDAGRPATP